MTDPGQNGTARPNFVQWIIDTRPLWHVPKKTSRREEVAELKNTVRILIDTAWIKLKCTRPLVLSHFYQLPNKPQS
jgi:hypothetical protein